MLQPFRDRFNANFSPARYAALLQHLNQATRATIDFRVCETPCFFPRPLLEEMADLGSLFTHQLIEQPGYLAAADASIPPRFRAANQDAHPHFMTVDFGIARDASGRLSPKLVELQAFPSVFGYQNVLTAEYRRVFELDPELDCMFGGHTPGTFWSLMKTIIVGDDDPEQVVLAEVEPDTQKTLPDFHVHEDMLGIHTVDIASIRKEGRQLLYNRNGRWTPIRRIYNRAIADEIVRKDVKLNFDYRDDLDVEWAGHPNWYFRLSKFSLPYLHHPAVPAAVFLDDWFAARQSDNGQGTARLPADRSQILLKPLFSFAGKGIQFAPTDQDLAAIAPEDRSGYLLQERATFEPVIETPEGKTFAEVRIMYLWPDGGSMQPVLSLVRLGRGLMMGVDQNRNQAWVGGSAAFFPRK